MNTFTADFYSLDFYICFFLLLVIFQGFILYYILIIVFVYFIRFWKRRIRQKFVEGVIGEDDDVEDNCVAAHSYLI